MPHSRPPRPPLLRSAVAACALLSAAVTMAADSIPAARPIPPAAMNLNPKGPPLPGTDPVEPPHPAAIPLWPQGAPGSESRKDEPENISWRQEPDLVFPVISNIQNPSLTPFLPAKGKSTGCAVIIAPGGGHWQLTIGREGYDLAQWFADHGIAAFVLKYRLANDISNPPGRRQPYQAAVHAVADGSRAIRVVRSHAAEWGLDPQKIGILGFSAGGACVTAAVRFDEGRKEAADPVERVSSRPDFQALIYADILNDGTPLPRNTPPAFLLCAYDDHTKVQPAIDYFLRLKSAGVPAEIHIYSSGGHGFGLRLDRPTLPISSWPTRLVEWLGDRGLIGKN